MNYTGQGPFCCACGVYIPEFDYELYPTPEYIEEYGPLSEKEKDMASRCYWSSIYRLSE